MMHHMIQDKEITVSGKGIGIAFLDTGISPVEDFTKPQNRIVAFRDFIHHKTTPYDDNGHGTHVTGIACGNGFLSQKKYQGVAPLAHIISLKILDQLGQGNSARAISAFQWILDNMTKYNIRIVNLSIGTNDRKVNRSLMEAVEQLWNRGIVVIAAASNPEGQQNFQPPPVLSPKILTVGAWEDRSYFQTPHKSFLFSEEPKTMPDVWTYGNNIISVLSPEFNFSLQNRSVDKIVASHYVSMSGTSMATPVISGITALLLEQNPNLTPNQIKKMLCCISEKHGGLLTVSSFLS